MGGAFARNLLRDGFSVMVFDLNVDAVAQAVGAGARAATGIVDLATECSVVSVVVVDEEQADGVLLGSNDDGLLASAQPGTIVMVHSTVGPQAMARYLHEAEANGIDLLDVPMVGGPSAARDGTLVLLVAGDRVAVNEVRPVLDCLSREFVTFRQVGQAQVVKLASNMILAINLQAVREATALAEQSGVAPDELLEVLAKGSGDSWVLRNWRALGTAAANYSGGVHAAARLTVKDLNLAMREAKDGGESLPLTALAAAECAEAYAAAARTKV